MKQKVKMNYQGEVVYLGIDVHKRHYSLCVVHDSVVIKSARIPAVYRLVVEFLERNFPGATVCSAYESGFSGFGLHRFLELAGVQSHVVNPASIEVSARDRVKTDKRDAKKIAVQLAAKRLVGVRVPSIEQEQKRVLTRTREQLVRQRSRLSNQIKGKLFQFGLIDCTETSPAGEKFFKKYLEMPLCTELKQAIELLVAQWRFVTAQLKEMKVLLDEQARDDKLESIYRSVPGIGPITSRTLSNELGDMSQFPNERKLFSYLGFTCSERSSGDSRRQGHITRKGSARLRGALVEAAWTAIRKDAGLRESYLRISNHSGGKRAIVAIARKMIGRIRSCLTKGEYYQLSLAA